jgi:hypothetical protein
MKLIALLLFPISTLAQTAFPSLQIPYHSRGMGMGDMGIAVATENQQLYYNAAKTAFTHHFHQVTASYMPWMATLTNDTRVMNLNYVGSTLNGSAIGASLSYLDYGTMEVRDNNGATLVAYKPREYSLGISYALRIASTASLGVTMKMIGQNVYTDAPRNLFSMCGDVGYYQYINVGDESHRVEWGLTVRNLGPKVIIPGNTEKTALPMTVGFGIGYSSADQEGNEFIIGADFTKPGIPSRGGDWKALRIGLGLEYGWQSSFFLRGGLSLENKERGNRQFFSLGAGYKGFVQDQSWGIDLHYIIPFGTVAAVSPFQNSVGMTLKVNIGNFQ